jgi:hypothetical protein
VKLNVVVALAVVLAVVFAVGGCRRKHVAPVETEAPAAPPTATAESATPSGASANPLNEPVLPPRDDRPRMPDGGTLNDDPRGPRPAEWQTIVDHNMSLLQACFDRADLPPGEITVNMHYTVELPGYTGAVTATGPAPRAVLDCCIKVVEELKFPEYRGAKVERDLDFTWAKRMVTRDAGAAPPQK